MRIPVGRIGLLVFFASNVGAAELVELSPVLRDTGISVSFRVAEAFDDDIESSVQSGLPVTFRYKVELKRNRRFWMNPTIAVREISATVTYDNLTRQYSLILEIDGEMDRTEVVADVQTMKHFMTSFDSLPLFELSLIQPNGQYYVRVKGVMKERNLFLFIPWDAGTNWAEAHFTYLP